MRLASDGFDAMLGDMDLIKTAVLLFIVLDPLGLVPVVHSMIAGYSPKRRKRILVRESLFALAILLLFLFAGNALMQFLELEQSALNITGGILLFMVSIGMVFPNKSVTSSSGNDEVIEPFIVPIAVPLMAGPSAIAIILLQSSAAQDAVEMSLLGGAVFLAWLAAAVVLYLSQYLIKFLGDRGMVALERLMGMILTMISIQMFLNGLHQV